MCLARPPRECVAVIASHPFTLDAIHSISAAPLWYEAQDVEYTMKASLLHGAPGPSRCWRPWNVSNVAVVSRPTRYGCAPPRTEDEPTPRYGSRSRPDGGRAQRSRPR